LIIISTAMTAAPERSIKETHGMIAMACVIISKYRTVVMGPCIVVRNGKYVAAPVTTVVIRPAVTTVP